MVVEISYNGSDNYLVVGLEGDYSIGDVRSVINQFETDMSIESLEMVLHVDEGISIALPEEGGDVGLPLAPTSASRTASNLQIDSVPYHIVELLAGSDEPLRTEEITEELEEVDLEQNEIASRLWNLSERGLVEKHPYQDDKRQKVYRLTTLGQNALEEARERREQAA